MPNLFRVILPVSNINAAAEFYGSVLGEKGVRVSDGRHYFDCGGVILACFDPRADGDDHDPTPNSEWLYFSVEDIESTHATLKSAGGKLCAHEIHGAPAGEIHKRPWGERSFYARDPFGNRICFVDHTTVFTGS